MCRVSGAQRRLRGARCWQEMDQPRACHAGDYDDEDGDGGGDGEHDGPEVLSAARHGQHDQPGQTNARQPEQELH